MDLRLSIGTEVVLGLRKVKTDALPTTAYLMLGSSCSNSCMFCPQSNTSRAKENLLSRVVWNKPLENIWPMIQNEFAKGQIQRSCIQVVNKPGIFKILTREIERARAYSGVPLCVSGGVDSLENIDKLLGLGVDRVTIALDAVTYEIYRKIKGQDFLKRLELLKEGAVRYPGRIGTHLIVGLGETEEEMIEMIQEMYDRRITAALFAFTPIKGTQMEQMPQPPIDSYRRIQIAHYLIKQKLRRKEDMSFESGKIVGLSGTFNPIRELLADGSAFLTSGCPGCNRPYYNEKPGSVLYNYPRKMTREEIERAIEEAGLSS